MLFRAFEVKLLMSLHSHKEDENGRYISIPKLFEVNDSGDKLVMGNRSNRLNKELPEPSTVKGHA